MVDKLLNDAVVALETQDLKACTEAGLKLMEWNKEETQVEDWPDIPDDEWLKVNQKARKLALASVLKVLAATV